MRCDYVFIVISNLEGICPITQLIAYHINWSIADIYIGNNFLTFVTPVYVHDFYVVIFTDEEDKHNAKYLSNQFTKVDGACMIVEY